MRTLVTGGAGSGKSELAEALCIEAGGPLTYIATMRPYGSDAAARIRRHRALRQGKGFHTIEQYVGLDTLAPGRYGTVLLECLGNLVANELYAEGADEASARQRILQGLEALEAACETLVVVTNDVFADGTVYPEETQRYIRLLGEVNARMAQRYGRVAEVVCGIPIWHKGVRG